MPTNRVNAIEMYSKDSGTLTGGYDLLVESLDESCFLIRIVNASNRSVIVSYDGATDNDYIAASGTLQIPFQANSRIPNKISLLRKGQKVYLKGLAGSGYIYFAGYYNE